MIVSKYVKRARLTKYFYNVYLFLILLFVLCLYVRQKKRCHATSSAAAVFRYIYTLLQTMFSDTVQLADINDFILPEQDCVIETGNNVKLDTDSLLDDDIGSVRIKKKKKNEQIGHFNQMLEDKSTKTAKITLDDCLACSGCITSAETVLIKQQSTSEMESYLSKHSNAFFVVSISNQALLGIAKRYKMSTAAAFTKLSAFFKREYRAKHVLNTSTALEIVLKEAIVEFVTKYTAKYIEGQSKSETNFNFPIICSECPGFVCYAEKTCKESLLSHISFLKSPQQINGLLLKKYVSSFDCLQSDIYHLCVMPCYDKKLEAARKEFVIDSNSKIKEVDCVITSVEIERLLKEKNICNLSQYEHKEQAKDDWMDWLNVSETESECVVSDLITDRFGSHGYLENIFIFGAKQLFGIDVNEKDLKYTKLKNEDIEELTLSLSEKQIKKLPFKLRDEAMLKSGKVFRFLRCYGFRNIQNVIRRIERNRSKYHYVEVMSCPFGCLNGGGQINDIQQSKKM